MPSTVPDPRPRCVIRGRPRFRPITAPGHHGHGVTLPVLAVLGALALVIVVTVAPRAEVRSPAVAMVRVLVPSWRFFDTVGEHPRLLARTVDDSGDGVWHALLAPPRRAWWNVAWHPEGNLSLARHSLLDRLLADVARAPDDDPTAFVSYRLVLDQVRWARRDGVPGERIQFKLTSPSAVGPDLFVSSVHER